MYTLIFRANYFCADEIRRLWLPVGVWAGGISVAAAVPLALLLLLTVCLTLKRIHHITMYARLPAFLPISCLHRQNSETVVVVDAVELPVESGR